MQVRRIAWLATQTERFDEMVRLFHEVMGLPLIEDEPGSAVMQLPNGDFVEVFQPGEQGYPYFSTGPVAGFLVDDIDAARAELEAAGVELLGPVGRLSSGYAWSHFRAPDGNIYELVSKPE